MNDAGRRDQFVRGIALEIEPSGLNAHSKVDRPDMNAGKSSGKFCIIQIDIDSTELRELGKLPEDNRGHAPGVRGQNSTLPVRHFACQSEYEDMSININHGPPT